MLCTPLGWGGWSSLFPLVSGPYSMSPRNFQTNRCLVAGQCGERWPPVPVLDAVQTRARLVLWSQVPGCWVVSLVVVAVGWVESSPSAHSCCSVQVSVAKAGQVWTKLGVVRILWCVVVADHHTEGRKIRMSKQKYPTWASLKGVPCNGCGRVLSDHHDLVVLVHDEPALAGYEEALCYPCYFSVVNAAVK